jgi:hypothetical protein
MGLLTKKFIVMIVGFMMIAIFLMNGCDRDEDATERPDFREENAIAINADMSVTATMVDNFAEPHYSREELLEMVWEEALGFSHAFGEAAMTIERVSVLQEMVNVVLNFSGREAYAAYHESVMFVGTLAEAIDIGLSFGQPMFDVTDLDRIVDEETIMATARGYVLVTNEHHKLSPLVIETFGRILYVSEGFSRWHDNMSVRTEAGRGDFAYIVFQGSRGWR